MGQQSDDEFRLGDSDEGQLVKFEVPRQWTAVIQATIENFVMPDLMQQVEETASVNFFACAGKCIIPLWCFVCLSGCLTMHN